ncbi:MAG: type II toxin-antitoxin system ParD family antitoxin [Gammaproteobacteria bacterium]
MAKNTSINLGEHFTTFIGSQIKHGRYGSTSEVVRAALRLLENQETRLHAIREKLAASERQADNGEFASYSLEKLIEELDKDSTA